MPFDGTLSIDNDRKESKLDGTLLATEGSGDPFGDATTFLEDNGFSDGDQASISGGKGKIGAQSVIFMTDAKPLAVSSDRLTTPAPTGIPASAENIVPVLPKTPRLPAKTPTPPRKKTPMTKPTPQKGPRKSAAKASHKKAAALKKARAKKTAPQKPKKRAAKRSARVKGSRSRR